jgi:Leucine-rich repeat (LRR) protein
MEAADLAQLIEHARCDRSTKLDRSDFKLTILPNSISDLSDLSHLDLRGNQLTTLPENIDRLTMV